jgi:hypothetical protein
MNTFTCSPNSLLSNSHKPIVPPCVGPVRIAAAARGCREFIEYIPVPGTAAKPTPFGRPNLGLDLGPDMPGPLSQLVLVLRDGPRTEFGRDQIEPLLQVYHAKARPAEPLKPK